MSELKTNSIKFSEKFLAANTEIYVSVHTFRLPLSWPTKASSRQRTLCRTSLFPPPPSRKSTSEGRNPRSVLGRTSQAGRWGHTNRASGRWLKPLLLCVLERMSANAVSASPHPCQKVLLRPGRYGRCFNFSIDCL